MKKLIFLLLGDILCLPRSASTFDMISSPL